MGVVPRAVRRGRWYENYFFYSEVVGYEYSTSVRDGFGGQSDYNKRLFLHCVAPGGAGLPDERFVVQIEHISRGFWPASEAPALYVGSMTHDLRVDEVEEFERIYSMVRSERPVYFSSMLLSFLVDAYLDWSRYEAPWQTSDETKAAMSTAFQIARSDPDRLAPSGEGSFATHPGDWIVFTGSEDVGGGDSDDDVLDTEELLNRRIEQARDSLSSAEAYMRDNPNDRFAKYGVQLAEGRLQRLVDAKASLGQ